MPVTADLSHHILGIPPVLQAMQERGFSAQECLKGTGLSAGSLSGDEARRAFHLGQELVFFRNCLALSNDPCLGLELGRCYTLERLGILGLALLSAHSMRQALNMIGKFSLLSYSLFQISVQIGPRLTTVSFHPGIGMPDDLLAFYADRDISAALFCIASVLPKPLQLDHLALVHGQKNQRERYEKFFGCRVTFGAPHSEFAFVSELLDTSMPLNDSTMANMCRLQCEQMIARLSKRSSVVDEIRWRIMGNPRAFPTLENMAGQLEVSSRTLRRWLSDEGLSYQGILDEIRFGLARDYLTGSQLSLQDIADLLGFAYPGNFTHAFKRWSGVSPRAYRQQHPLGLAPSVARSTVQ